MCEGSRVPGMCLGPGGGRTGQCSWEEGGSERRVCSAQLAATWRWLLNSYTPCFTGFLEDKVSRDYCLSSLQGPGKPTETSPTGFGVETASGGGPGHCPGSQASAEAITAGRSRTAGESLTSQHWQQIPFFFF